MSRETFQFLQSKMVDQPIWGSEGRSEMDGDTDPSHIQMVKSIRLITSDRKGEVEDTNQVSKLVAGVASCTIIWERLNHCV